MATEVRSFAVTIPAGTTADSPQTTALAFPPRIVDELEIVVPPGPAGNVGFAIAASGQPILPYNAGEWLITDDEVIRWPLSGFIDSGAWQCIAYNTGTLDHTIYIRFLLELVTAGATVAPATLISADQLAGPATVDLGG